MATHSISVQDNKITRLTSGMSDLQGAAPFLPTQHQRRLSGFSARQGFTSPDHMTSHQRHVCRTAGLPNHRKQDTSTSPPYWMRQLCPSDAQEGNGALCTSSHHFGLALRNLESGIP
ncbi:uncharacterized protein AB9X84_005375 isoform 1-T1 [Acanthopagrus schlegelii]